MFLLEQFTAITVPYHIFVCSIYLQNLKCLFCTNLTQVRVSKIITELYTNLKQPIYSSNPEI